VYEECRVEERPRRQLPYAEALDPTALASHGVAFATETSVLPAAVCGLRYVPGRAAGEAKAAERAAARR